MRPPASTTDEPDPAVTLPPAPAATPVVVLVEPQMAENIGTTARAMANFGLSRLRLVAPRDGWPNAKAYPAASGANRVLDEAELFDTLDEAIGDLTYVLATTARQHDQAKPVLGPREAVGELVTRIGGGGEVGVIFGRERNGLLNGEVALADAILTYPVNPDFSSLNLAQAVLVLGYEWFTQARGGVLPYGAPHGSEPATKAQMLAFFRSLETSLDRVEFFRPPEKREGMVINLRNIFQRMALTRQDVATLHGVVTALAEGAQGPARGGTLTPDGAEALRNFLADSTRGLTGGTAPIRGISRLIRRNPTEAEKALWEVLVKDRALPAAASSGRCPSARMSPTSSPSTSGWSSISSRTRKGRRRPAAAPRNAPGSPSAATASSSWRRGWWRPIRRPRSRTCARVSPCCRPRRAKGWFTLWCNSLPAPRVSVVCSGSAEVMFTGRQHACAHNDGSLWSLSPCWTPVPAGRFCRDPATALSEPSRVLRAVFARRAPATSPSSSRSRCRR